jgi:hypothetical protein
MSRGIFSGSAPHHVYTPTAHQFVASCKLQVARRDMASAQLKARRRDEYKFELEYRTRWYSRLIRPVFAPPLTALRSDNDMYHHLNNSIYYFLCVDSP